MMSPSRLTRLATRGALPALAVALGAVSARADDLPASGDPSHGRVLFQQSCALCHATGTEARPVSGQGPLLAGIAGRKAGSLPGFGYTPALRASGLTWDATTLDRFLSNPSALVPGTAMVISVPSAADRADVVAYLVSLKAVAASAVPSSSASAEQTDIGSWLLDSPGTHHEVKIADLPAPYATSAAGNGPQTVERPAGAVLSVPAGFTVKAFLSNLSGPRLLRTAPNGDIFVAETREGRIRVLRSDPGASEPSRNEVFASGLTGPFGIAFYPLGPDPQWIYIGNLNAVVRFPYRNGDLVARGPAEVIVPRLTVGTGGHSTRDLAFSLDGGRLFISVGSGSNVAEGMPKAPPGGVESWEAAHGLGAAWGFEQHRANVLQTNPEGTASLKPYATGIRNPVGIAVDPASGVLWVSTNERDNLGDNLVPDYVSHIEEGKFYGWPWYYMGNHEDPRHAGERPDLDGKITNPDVPVQPHSASLELAFYTATSGPAAFPAEYRGDIFAAEHGSWNRNVRTGSKVIRIHRKNGVPVGGYEDFLTGFVVDNHDVWGRPVGVTVAPDGALLVSDDASGTIWRIAYGP